MSEFALAEVQEAVSARVSDRPAIRWRGGTLTHDTFTQRTRQLSSALREAGLGPSSHVPEARWETHQKRVAILMFNRPEWLEAMFGCFKARALPFNVNYRYVGAEMGQLIALAKPDALIFESRFADLVGSLREHLGPDVLLIQVADDSDQPLLEGARDYEYVLAAAGHPDLPEVSADDGYLLYTGGTTGLPKGVLWRQGDAYVAAFGGRNPSTGDEYQSLDEILARISAQPRPSLTATPLMHGAGQWNAVIALLGGNTVVLPDVVDHLDPADVWRTAEREGVKLLGIAGNAFAAPLLDELDREPNYDLSQLRFVVSGAVKFGSDLKTKMLAKVPRLTIIDNCGSSETGSQMELRSTKDQTAESGVFEPSSGTVVLTDDLSAQVGPGSAEVGWLARKGRVPLAYMFDEKATAKTFPIVDGTRFSITGDRAVVRADGRIEYQGRESMTINSGGEKIFAEEVEAALSNHDAVADVLVVGRPSERWGSEVTAIVQWTTERSATLSEIRTHGGRTLAPYKLPRRLVTVEKIQRLDSGKADYRWAAQAALACTGDDRSN